MKLSYLIVGLVLIGFIVGCTETPEQPAAPAPAAPAPVEPAPVEPAEPVPETVEIKLLVSGYDPAEDVTINVGDTIVFNAVEGNHQLTITGGSTGGQSTGRIDQETTKEQTFDEAGTYKVFDIFTKKSTNIVVVEAAAAEGEAEEASEGEAEE